MSNTSADSADTVIVSLFESISNFNGTAVRKYKLSSYSANALGRFNAAISPHEEYLDLGLNRQDRESAYRRLFDFDIDEKLKIDIRAATNGNFALGNDKFKSEIEAALLIRARPGKPGRPKTK